MCIPFEKGYNSLIHKHLGLLLRNCTHVGEIYCFLLKSDAALCLFPVMLRVSRPLIKLHQLSSLNGSAETDVLLS